MPGVIGAPHVGGAERSASVAVECVGRVVDAGKSSWRAAWTLTEHDVDAITTSSIVTDNCNGRGIRTHRHRRRTLRTEADGWSRTVRFGPIPDTMTQAAAGWYADPNDASLERWWDGVAWTNDVR